MQRFLIPLLSLALLALACSAGVSQQPLGNIEPANTSTPVKDAGPAVGQSFSSTTGVEVVYTRPGFPAPHPRDPLWGDQAVDQPAITKLVRALESADLVDGPLDQLPHDRAEYLVIRHSDGSITQVRRAWDCARTNGGDSCEAVRNRWVVAGPEVALESKALQRWWDAMPDYMPYVERLIGPDRAYQGQPFVLRGQGWHESGPVELRIFPQYRRSEGTRLLDRVPLDHGAFFWEGVLPRKLDPGEYTILAEAGPRSVSKEIKVVESEG